jgi:hypothetical protein
MLQLSFGPFGNGLIMKHFTIIVLIVFLCSSCKKNDIVDQPTDTQSARMKIIGVIPNTAIAGDVIAIIGENLDSTYQNHRIYIDALWSAVDSGNYQTLYTRVPWKATLGNVSVIKFLSDRHGAVDIDSAKGHFLTISPIDTTKFNIIHYSGSQLTEAQSWVTDDAGVVHKWSGSKNGDTVFINQRFTFGDEGSCTEEFSFYSLPADTIPSSVSGYVKTIILEAYYNSTNKGLVAVQDWNVNDRISGRISVYDEKYFSWSDYIFWYSFK